MHITTQKEHFSIAYIQAMVATCGFNYNTPKIDDHSVDMEVFTTYPYNPEQSHLITDPRICLQLKATERLEFKNGVASFSLSKKNYDDLRAMGYQNPRYLIILDLPKSTAQWLKHKKKFMALKNHFYWVSLANLANSKNRTKVNITVPINQRLTTETLIKMLEKARTGERYEQEIS